MPLPPYTRRYSSAVMPAALRRTFCQSRSPFSCVSLQQPHATHQIVAELRPTSLANYKRLRRLLAARCLLRADQKTDLTVKRKVRSEQRSPPKLFSPNVNARKRRIPAAICTSTREFP